MGGGGASERGASDRRCAEERGLDRGTGYAVGGFLLVSEIREGIFRKTSTTSCKSGRREYMKNIQ